MFAKLGLVKPRLALELLELLEVVMQAPGVEPDNIAYLGQGNIT